jgi:hypothetical protein
VSGNCPETAFATGLPPLQLAFYLTLSGFFVHF